ncbi:MAG: biopolymer transporter ExbD [Candidatus Omnitrophica bacterium]|nr:biopolymer transporter ExbD [Candidatus Omnitrophota bacterium]MDD5574878.1 biopolymer transporter ExbD [Candidatus Omnitrophota bacterium]
MKIAPNRRYMFSLESVAMTDIVLNMFIFFFISFSLIYTFSPTKAKHIKVNLPAAKHVMNPGSSGGYVTIVLSGEGPLYLQGEVVTTQELEGRLSVMRQDDPGLTVVVQIDRLVPFKNVVRVLDVLNGLGIERLRIAAQQEK